MKAFYFSQGQTTLALSSSWPLHDLFLHFSLFIVFLIQSFMPSQIHDPSFELNAFSSFFVAGWSLLAVFLGILITMSFRLDLSIGRVWGFMGMVFLGSHWRSNRGSKSEGEMDWLLHFHSMGRADPRPRPKAPPQQQQQQQKTLLGFVWLEGWKGGKIENILVFSHKCLVGKTEKWRDKKLFVWLRRNEMIKSRVCINLLLCPN